MFEGIENSLNKDLINKHSNHFDSNQCVLWCKCNLGFIPAGDHNCIQSDLWSCLHAWAILLINSIIEEIAFVVRPYSCYPHKNILHNVTQRFFSCSVMSSHQKSAKIPETLTLTLSHAPALVHVHETLSSHTDQGRRTAVLTASPVNISWRACACFPSCIILSSL